MWGSKSNLSGETNTEIGGTRKKRKTHLTASHVKLVIGNCPCYNFRVSFCSIVFHLPSGKLQFAIENGHRNNGFCPLKTMDLSIAILTYPEGNQLGNSPNAMAHPPMP